MGKYEPKMAIDRFLPYSTEYLVPWYCVGGGLAPTTRYHVANHVLRKYRTVSHYPPRIAVASTLLPQSPDPQT